MNDRFKNDRRKFVKNTVSICGTLPFLSLPGFLLDACKSSRGASRSLSDLSTASAKNLRIRKSIFDTSNQDIETYIKAFDLLKATPAWTELASIHQDFCPHGNWFFLPWHRVFLYHFEAIIGELAGDRQFALPYWDWDGNERDRLPPAVLRTNGLYWEKRGALAKTGNERMDGRNVGPLAMNRIMAANNFLAFGSNRASAPRSEDGGGSGLLESMPHNSTHVWVGGDDGDMASFMSPLDPIFWMHHCNIDRIWSSWATKQRQIGRSEVAPEGSRGQIRTSAWLKTELKDGFKELKTAAPIVLQAAKKAFSIQQTLDWQHTFGYDYDQLVGTPKNVAQAQSSGVAARSRGLEATTAAVSASFQISMKIPLKRVFVMEKQKVVLFALDIEHAKGQDNSGQDFTATDLLKRFKDRITNLKSFDEQPNFTMTVDGVPLPTNPGETSLDLYLNLDKNLKPERNQDDFLGTHFFFGHDHTAPSKFDSGEHHHSLKLIFDLAENLRDRNVELLSGNAFVSVFIDSPNEIPEGLKEEMLKMTITVEYDETSV